MNNNICPHQIAEYCSNPECHKDVKVCPHAIRVQKAAKGRLSIVECAREA
jgi:hypothetical protein